MTTIEDEGTVSPRPDASISTDQAAGPGTVIGFHYDLYDQDGVKIETSRDKSPMLCLFGQREMLVALQEAFIGKVAGDEFSVSIDHTKAYGRHNPERCQRVSRKKIDGGKKQTFRSGQIITMDDEHGRSQARIVKVGKFNVDVDSNHPLAGVDLKFDISIDSVRQASDEERAHGHAHGVGGHQH